ncbi:MAG: protein kinase [Planctomycetota bacterium]|nr:protein kinase [Planctomycetota bacterium]
MATRYDVRFLAAAIKANYLNETRAKELFDAFAASGSAEKGATLASFAREQNFLSDSQVDILERVVGNDPATEKKPASRIGPYEPVSKLGSGGMGVVVKARQSETGEVVALKILPRRLYEDPEYIQRFVREANNASRLNHPNIMRGLGANKTEDGLYYYAMEFIDGESVQAIIDRMGSIPESQAIAISIRVTRALQHASESAIIHRDIKPENIMINRDGKVKLTDLGLAKEMLDSRVTQTGIALGTPHYMSPEQARGDKEIDIRSDIYSLGATLYHMLTGQPPFVGKSAAVVITKHLMEQVPSPQEIKSEVSTGICKVIARMMAKEQEDRYPNPKALNQDLELVARGEEPKLGNIENKKTSVKVPLPVSPPAEESSRPPPKPRSSLRTRKSRRDKKKSLVAPILSAIIGLLLFALAALIVMNKSEPPKPPKQTPRPETQPKTTIQQGDNLQDKLREQIRLVKEFEDKHKDAPGMQEEIISRWQKLLPNSRGTEQEKSIADSLAAAKAHAATLAVPEDPQQAQEAKLAQAEEQARLWIAQGKLKEALGAFDDLLKQELTASISQRASQAQGESQQRVIKAALSRAQDFSDSVNEDEIENARQLLNELTSLGLDKLTEASRRLDRIVTEYDAEQQRLAAFKTRMIRTRTLEKVLKLVGLQEFDPAEAIVASELSRTDNAGLERDLRNAQQHIRDLARMWKRIRKNAPSLVGKKMKHHGPALMVTGYQDMQFILDNDRFRKPLHELEPALLWQLAARDANNKAPEYHRDASIFWLYKSQLEEAEKAMDAAGQMGVNLSEFRSVYRALKQLQEERAAQQLFLDAQKENDREQWKKALAALDQLEQMWAKTAFVHLQADRISATREFAQREGREPLLHGRLSSLPDGVTQVIYDFQDPAQFEDWSFSNNSAVARKGILLPRTNWLLHRAEFDSVLEISFEAFADRHYGEGHANIGWGIELTDFPLVTDDPKAVKSGVIGRLYSRGDKFSTMIAPGKLLQQSLEMQFRAEQPLSSRVRIEDGTVRWHVDEKEFMRYTDYPSGNGKRIALFSEESNTVFRKITVKGKLAAGWEDEAIADQKRHVKARKTIASDLRRSKKASLFPENSLSAWWPPSAYWQSSNSEVKFTGGPDEIPITCPVSFSGFTLSGRFQQPENVTTGWKLGLRTGGPFGYFIHFDPAREIVTLSKVIESQEDDAEAIEVVELSKKEEVYLVPGSWQSFKAVADGEELSLSLDNQSLLFATDGTFSSGILTISSVKGLGESAPVSFKNFEVVIKK